MKMFRSTILLGVLVGVTLSGCATVMSGTSQGLTIETDPAGATCSVARSGEQIAATSATPSQVMISKGWSALDIECKKNEHLTAKDSLSPTFQPWTLGNILIGGGIGLIIDAASGAMVQYPRSVMLFLVPSRFSSQQERDAYFERKRVDIEAEATRLIAETQKKCASSSCEEIFAGIELKKKQRLADLESQRSAVRVDPS